MANLDSEKNDISDVKATASATLDFDAILQEEVGHFRWYQVRTIILGVIAVVFVGWSNNSYVFTTVRIQTRCHIPECDLDDAAFAPGWLPSAVPGGLGSLDNCQRFANASGEANATLLGQDECPAGWFDRDQLQSCERYVYQNTDTLVYDFNLACDEWRRSLIGSVRLLGTMLAQPLAGLVSDRRGRRAALVLSAVNAAWLGVLKSFSNSYTVFILLELLQAIIGSSTYQSTDGISTS
ncbi:solute carrier family 22 member 1-like [Ostrinia furnacalis]|uniref:solute carrier family 22 member 1-like n=1 Tax=Ostrinia furnacalis TaxID=93504 RepID=UPI00103BD8F4|nr:solute carrier family 22 member 1-like [Ostrinia furnacalis]